LESGFYTIPLGGVDIILGIQWLQMLETYSANHQKQFIKFKWEGRQYKLYGFQPNYILTTNGETNSKRSTSLHGTLSSDGVINNRNSQVSTSIDSNINPKI
jgi:hypothetical protein